MFSLHFDVRALQPGYFDRVTVQKIYTCGTNLTNGLFVHLIMAGGVFFFLFFFTHEYSYKSKLKSASFSPAEQHQGTGRLFFLEVCEDRTWQFLIINTSSKAVVCPWVMASV